MVPHDFKANLERTSTYVPERKLLSGNEDSGYVINSLDLASSAQWRTAVKDWRMVGRGTSDDSSSVDIAPYMQSDARCGSETSIDVMTDVLPRVSERPSVRVEPLSPSLLAEWNKAQKQNLLAAIPNNDTDFDRVTADSANSDQHAGCTSSANSVSSEQHSSSIGSDSVAPSRCSSNESASSAKPSAMYEPPYHTFDAPPNVSSNIMAFPSHGFNNMLGPNTFTPVMPVHVMPVPRRQPTTYHVTPIQAASLAPIGTPYVNSSGYGSSLPSMANTSQYSRVPAALSNDSTWSLADGSDLTDKVSLSVEGTMTSSCTKFKATHLWARSFYVILTVMFY